MRTGILLLAGFFQGSFGLGYKDYRPLPWAAFWLVYNLFCLGTAAIWTFFQAPGFLPVLFHHPEEAAVIFVCGVIWGASAICFTKGVDLLGMALLYGISMGFSIIGGSIFPLLLHPQNLEGNILLNLGAGLALSGAGIFLITAGGRKRDGAQGAKKNRLGTAMAVFSGIGSALMNLGFGYGQNITAELSASGIGDVGISAASWFLVILGGNAAMACYCVPQIVKGRLFSGLKGKGLPRRLVILLFTAMIWYGALCLYGVYTAQAGAYGIVVGWVIFNALALIVSNLWGLLLGEWKGAGEGLRLAAAGDVLLMAAWIFLARLNAG
ncbi:MAG TPA: hypothetical protein IAA51_03590 [Candidatus Cottocaccamicrobium excrementipullorum]|nr:hypothetical protein [Candidatus Cottocaccamicrobium excrementipullorum]